MAGKLTDDGAKYFLSLLLRNASLPDLTLHLFKNDVIPDQWSYVDTFEEADFTGYSTKQLFYNLWQLPTIVASGGLAWGMTDIFLYKQFVSWTCYPPYGGDVYGYYAEREGTVYFAENFKYKGMSKTDVLTIHPYVIMRGIQP